MMIDVSFVLQSVTHRRYIFPLPNRLDTIQAFNGFPGEPAACHEPNTKSVTSSTPVPSLILVKMVGPSPLMIFASRSMIARDADTSGAMSIYLSLTVKPSS